mmetsp:Transcript_452/g.1202  ORF Transcript_452/g.1202 Transcript_452/m.1202 type:complete len:203 (+) Transcript_452:383-991(+)
MRETRAVDSCVQAVNQSTRESSWARGFIISLSTKCVNTRSAVNLNPVPWPSELLVPLPRVEYRRPVHGSTTFGCLKSKSPTATSKDCLRVRSSNKAPMPLARATSPASSPFCVKDKGAEASLFFGKRMENKSCKFSSQNFLETVMYLHKLMAPKRRITGSLRKFVSIKQAKMRGLMRSNMLLAPKMRPLSAISANASASRSS